jgi:hypothetical protein
VERREVKPSVDNKGELVSDILSLFFLYFSQALWKVCDNVDLHTFSPRHVTSCSECIELFVVDGLVAYACLGDAVSWWEVWVEFEKYVGDLGEATCSLLAKKGNSCKKEGRGKREEREV